MIKINSPTKKPITECTKNLHLKINYGLIS